MAFTKLMDTLPESSVWCEPYPTRIVWVTMLATVGPDGIVRGSVPGLAKRSGVTLEECKTALEYFLSPDEYSSSPEYEGRRIEVVEGGWRLLNYFKYRAVRDEAERREYMRSYMQKKRSGTTRTSSVGSPLTSVSTVNSGKPHLAKEVGEEEEEKNVPSESFTPEMIVSAVLDECRLSGRDLQTVLEDVARAELKAGRDPDELRNALIAAYRQYSDAKPRLSYTKGAAKFFGDGDWRNPAGWPWKDGAKPTANPPDRYANTDRLVGSSVTVDHRPLPASEHHERCILGLMLKDETALAEARASLTAPDFFLDSHRRIFRAVSALDDERMEANFATVGQWLTDHRELESVGGHTYLAQLDADMPAGLRVGSYVKVVKEKARLRRLIETCQTTINGAYESSPSMEIVGALQDGIEGVIGDEEDDPLVESFTVSALDEFDAERSLQQSPGLSFGIPQLDAATGGMRKGEVIVAGARSGVGKTSLVDSGYRGERQKGHLRADLFSLEMTRNQILRRIWSIVSGVPYKRVTDPWKASMEEAERVRTAASKVYVWPLRIHDNSEMPLSKIVMKR